MQNGLTLLSYLGTSRLRHMNVAQTACMISYATTQFLDNVFMPLAMVGKPLCLLFAPAVIPLLDAVEPPESYNSPRLLLLTCLIYRTTSFLHTILTSQAVGYRMMLRNQQASAWMNLMMAVPVAKDRLSAAMGGKRLGFVVTGAANSELMEEQSALKRPTLAERLWIATFGHDLWFCAFVFGLAAYTMSSTTLWISQRASHSAEMWTALLTTSLFPDFGWDLYIHLLAPFVYIIFPPTAPERRRLMDYYEKDGLWRPKEEAKKEKWTRKTWGLLLPSLLALVWSAVAVWIAFGLKGSAY